MGKRKLEEEKSSNANTVKNTRRLSLLKAQNPTKALYEARKRADASDLANHKKILRQSQKFQDATPEEQEQLLKELKEERIAHR